MMHYRRRKAQVVEFEKYGGLHLVSYAEKLVENNNR